MAVKQALYSGVCSIGAVGATAALAECKTAKMRIVLMSVFMSLGLQGIGRVARDYKGK